MKTPKNLFIDTNIFLSFYHFTKDDLEELDKLVVLLENKEIRLFLPKQVEEEFWRNREAKIADALKRLREQKLNLQFPQLSKGYAGYNKLRSLQKEYEKEHQGLLDALHSDAKSNKLKADKTIHSLFKLAKKIDIDEVVSAAKLRVERGNPPGKSGSLGDAINWEALTKSVKDGEDIYFITDDKDYSSALGEDEFNEFLLSEWKESKNSSLFLSPAFGVLQRESAGHQACQ